MICVTSLFLKKQHRLISFAMRNSTLRAQRKATVDVTETPGFSAKNSEFYGHTTLMGKYVNLKSVYVYCIFKKIYYIIEISMNFSRLENYA